MKMFACILDTTGVGISSADKRLVEAVPVRRGLNHRWDMSGHAAVLTAWDSDGGEIAFERTATHIAAGQVRLDNRPEIEQLYQESEPSDARASDLAVVLRAVAHRGVACIPKLLGDFAFVVWDTNARIAIAACDPFAIRTLYYTQRDGLTVFGSRAEPLSTANRYDIGYLGELLTYNAATRHRTVYEDVACLRCASYLTVRSHAVATSRYWSPMEYALGSHAHPSERDGIDACRDLIATSLRLRMDTGGRTWSQLSGGLDSSTIVSLTEWLAERGDIPHGLAGTLTFVYGTYLGNDERQFSDQVLRRWGVRNEAIVEAPWFAESDGSMSALPDQPTITMMLSPLYKRAARILRDAGARVLLAGQGGDQLFTGDMMYFADRLVREPVFRVLGDMAHIAALGRIPFWPFAYKEAIVPLLPPLLQRRSLRDMNVVPDWMRKDTLKRAGVAGRIDDQRYSGPVGQKYAYCHAAEFARLERHDEWITLSDVLSVRQPFLYRPLVEFALQLPPEFCVRPYARKWVLREAMRGILPDGVRTRVGKGGNAAGVSQAFNDGQPLFDAIAKDPILADLGLVDAKRLRESVTASYRASGRHQRTQADAISTLAIELWLQIRAGRWPHGLIVPGERPVNRELLYA